MAWEHPSLDLSFTNIPPCFQALPPLPPEPSKSLAVRLRLCCILRAVDSGRTLSRKCLRLEAVEGLGQKIGWVFFPWHRDDGRLAPALDLAGPLLLEVRLALLRHAAVEPLAVRVVHEAVVEDDVA